MTALAVLPIVTAFWFAAGRSATDALVMVPVFSALSCVGLGVVLGAAGLPLLLVKARRQLGETTVLHGVLTVACGFGYVGIAIVTAALLGPEYRWP